MKSMISFFVRQHLFSNLITFLVLSFGIFSVIQIRKDLFPVVEFDITLVTAVMPGASPDQVEKLLINPIEEAVKEVDGIKKVQSNATNSRAVVTITIDPDARNPEKTNNDIQRAVDGITDLPAEVERPVVMALESGQTPIIEISLSSDEMDEVTIRDWTKYVADELALVPGVAKINKQAWQKKEYIVELEREKLEIYRVDLNRVVQSLQGQNVQLPAGDAILASGKEVAIKTDGEFKNLKDIEESMVTSNFEGYGPRIKNLGSVREGLEEPSLLYRTMGDRSYSMIVTKKEKADALKVVKAVQDRMAELQKKLPSDVKVKFVNDFTFYLKNRLGTLSSNMAFGIFLVMVVLALFLPWRVALVVAMGIPISMLGGLIILKALGFSINLISLIGLIIVSGMLVDDAIVVIENIFRKVESGLDIHDSIVDGTAEMVAPVTASVFTTVAAFSPMLFMTGIFGKFIFEIPVMVIVPLVLSLVEAFIIAPAHFWTWVGPKAVQTMQEIRKSNEKAHWYDRFLPKYQKWIAWTVENKFKALGLFSGVAVLTIVISTQMRFILFPPDGIYSFYVRLEAAPGINIKEMERLTALVEPEVLKLKSEELQDVVSQIGIHQNDPNDPFTKRASHYSQIRVNLTPENQRDRSVDEVVEALRKSIKAPEGVTKVSFEIMKGGPPQGKALSVNVMGEDFTKIRLAADEIKEHMKTLNGVTDIEDSEVMGKKEITVIPDQDRIKSLGLSTSQVAQTVRAAFAGIEATSLRSLDEEINIRVKLKEQRKEDSMDHLKGLLIGNSKGDVIPLERLASFQESDSKLVVKHEKYKRVIIVGAGVDLDKTTAIEANQALMAKMADFSKRHPDVSVEYAGENEDTQESLNSLFNSFGVATMMIFTILILTFGSFLQPFLVLLAIPLGFMGVVWALLIHGKPLSFMSMLGIISLAGVIVNNSIVFIDFYNQKKKELVDIKLTLVETATARLRPIILTSTTTVLGLLPTAYGIGGSDGFVAALALSLGWGLMMGSILTVLFFPSFVAITESILEETKSLIRFKKKA